MDFGHMLIIRKKNQYVNILLNHKTISVHSMICFKVILVIVKR